MSQVVFSEVDLTATICTAPPVTIDSWVAEEAARLRWGWDPTLGVCSSYKVGGQIMHVLLADLVFWGANDAQYISSYVTQIEPGCDYRYCNLRLRVDGPPRASDLVDVAIVASGYGTNISAGSGIVRVYDPNPLLVAYGASLVRRCAPRRRAMTGRPITSDEILALPLAARRHMWASVLQKLERYGVDTRPLRCEIFKINSVEVEHEKSSQEGGVIWVS